MTANNTYTQSEVVEMLKVAFREGEIWGCAYQGWFTPSESDTQERLQRAVDLAFRFHVELGNVYDVVMSGSAEDEYIEKVKHNIERTKVHNPFSSQKINLVVKCRERYNLGLLEARRMIDRLYPELDFNKQ